MAFDSKAFMQAKFVPREGEVPVEALKQWFGKGEKPVWKVKSLSGQELGVANAAAEKAQNLSAVAEAIQGRRKDKVEAFKKMLGVSDDMPADIAKRIELLMLGSVNPECDLEMALELCRAFAIEFFLITNKILSLTGQGHVVGKQKPSGTKKTSSTA